MTDKTLNCADCGQDFTFTASEQQFFADRQFSEPRRCATCRAVRKAARGGAGNGGSSYGNGGYSSGGGGYDRNATEPRTLLQMIDYIHNNPVRRGLVAKATDWIWSSSFI